MKAGSVISHYRILDRLGRGGMGIVYKAEDTKLDRIVALKVLPTQALASEDDRARFYREAKAAAALHHPNIATIFGIDEAAPSSGVAVPTTGGTSEVSAGDSRDDLIPFIAMEYVEGETLFERVIRGPLPLRDAVSIAIQIAEGLKVAHEKGIVHRDIKSGNVMLREDGRAKILDFGLAMTAASTRLTQLGSTLGTAAYMSPEQARGEEVDHRADLWSLGVVLYEMITGRVPFPGDYEQAIVYGILNADPEPVTGLRTGVPMELERIVTKLLAKDRARRYQNAADLIVDLEAVDVASRTLSSVGTVSMAGGAAATSVLNTAPSSAVAAQVDRKFPAWLLWMPISLVLFVAGLFGGRALWPTGEPPLRKYRIEAADLQDSAISPDGEHVAFSAGGALWVRALSDLNPRRIVDSVGVRHPFWSPESDEIGYLSDGKLFRIPVAGGTPVEICEVPFGGFVRALWANNGSVYFMVATGGASAEIFEVSGQGGNPRSFLKSTDDSEVYTYVDMGLVTGDPLLLAVLPVEDGRPSLFQVESDGTKKVIPGSESDGRIGSPVYSPSGHVVYELGNTLWAVPWPSDDSENAEPVRIATGAALPSVSLTGTLLYHSSTGGPLDYGMVYRDVTSSDVSDVVWVDRSGNEIEMIGRLVQIGLANEPVVSEDDSRIAVGVNRDIWLLQSGTDIKTRLTYDDSGFPDTWVPGTDLITYSRLSSGRGDIRVLDTRGSGLSYDLIATPDPEFGPTISSDGKYVVYHRIDAETRRDLYYRGLEINGDSVRTVGPAQTLVRTPFDEAMPEFSPDGRYVAYHANRTGRWEVYITRFPEGRGEWAISTGGGNVAYWRGGEIFYADPNGNLMAVPVDISGDQPVIGRAEVLFNSAQFGHNLINGFHNSFFFPRTDGQAIAIVRLQVSGEAAALTVVENWYSEFDRK